ncbi:NUDIX hydrolase [Phenylobacterium soli]|uniref:NUDIX hydrolase n=1 Tax=Phenylobacterium soli TaxID=2170551 RepID=UPI0014030EA7|nr:NUDIX domain-containing protein [Phenylobacterium soli]
MRRRLTARVLLFDPQGRLLLMKGRLASDPAAPGAWFTVGGGADPGESVLETAAREIREETGFEDFELGPVVWRREGALPLGAETVWMDEHYILARCAGGDPVRHGWQPDEHHLIDEIRWWTPAELKTTADHVFPPGLADLLDEIQADPAEPRWIPW